MTLIVGTSNLVESKRERAFGFRLDGFALPKRSLSTSRSQNLGGRFAAVLIGVLTGLAADATANDGRLASGGSPELLKGHPSVTMTSEFITITVNADGVDVNCNFVFTNHGPACTVRMGFPDRGVGSLDPDEDEDSTAVLKTPPSTTFDFFRSYVDGHRVKTKLIRGSGEGEYWHTKSVRFAAHGVRRVRDVYSQRVGGGLTVIGGRYARSSEIGYILNTGASWHGSIGRTEIVVKFRTTHPKGTLKAISLADADDPGAVYLASQDNAVLWRGMSAPSVHGRTLRFVRRNWRPTADDDLSLTYAYKLEGPAPKPTAEDVADEARAQANAARVNFNRRYLAYSNAFAHRDFKRIGAMMRSDYCWFPLDGDSLSRAQFFQALAERRAGCRMSFQILDVEPSIDSVDVTVRQTFSEPTPKDGHPKEKFQNVYSYTFKDTWYPTPKGLLLGNSQMLK